MRGWELDSTECGQEEKRANHTYRKIKLMPLVVSSFIWLALPAQVFFGAFA